MITTIYTYIYMYIYIYIYILFGMLVKSVKSSFLFMVAAGLSDLDGLHPKNPPRGHGGPWWAMVGHGLNGFMARTDLLWSLGLGVYLEYLELGSFEYIWDPWDPWLSSSLSFRSKKLFRIH